MQMNRRSLIIAAAAMLGGCVSGRSVTPLSSDGGAGAAGSAYHLSMYEAVETEPFDVPAIDLSRIEPQFLRQEVEYRTSEPVGTIVVDPARRFLYLVQEDGRALRYGVGVGKVEAFNFSGEGTIRRKARWPHWTPTVDMIAREPQRYGPLRAGLPGGNGNPLGPRALYIYRDGEDTLYRLHGTVEPWTIGRKVSSGCIRLLNQDIIDLYRRVPIGSRIVVLAGEGSDSA
ncbi:lipoprotein-anchoring transpeptidase ErfK/SrfK [Rhodopseudomonas julia]|uniref:Lipoprotein-anchoring transpeptidase ErfK/SrfK n=1 Tax=Rhodopseudomonas julia TaxID=200617 RepID=A0ABU0C5L9_9BRAD|nr:L,D-transpeptidase [Rhodopseudomonas julia]MDQ0325239.1 lipoprotein-anchoring transpeptidase ErfK/SrfK [Rhodopseudomonas julia]